MTQVEISQKKKAQQVGVFANLFSLQSWLVVMLSGKLKKLPPPLSTTTPCPGDLAASGRVLLIDGISEISPLQTSQRFHFFVIWWLKPVLSEKNAQGNEQQYNKAVFHSL